MPRRYVLWLIGLGAAIVVLLIALVVVMATGDDPDGTAADTSTTTEAPATTGPTVPPTTAPATTTEPPATTTSLPPTTTTTSPPTTTTTTEPPPSCIDAGPIPGGAVDLSEYDADYDGDGSPDTFAAYRLGTAWFLWADLSDGDYRLVTEIGLPWSFEHWDGTTPDSLRVLAAHALGDPRQVATVRIYQGLGAYYGLFAVEDCEIVALTDPDGTIPELWQAMGPGHTEFPVCDEAGWVRQTSFSCGADPSTCPTLDRTYTEYSVSRDPARVGNAGDETDTVDQAAYQAAVLRSCLSPPG